MKKTLISLLLVVLLALALAVPAMADNSTEPQTVLTVENVEAFNNALVDYDSSKQYIKLDDDFTEEELSVQRDLYLDLNGNSVDTINVQSGTLYLFDSQTDDYNVNDGFGYGTVGTINVIDGTFEREFTLPAAWNMPRYRYVTIKVGDVYSAHRFYVGVTQFTLYPTIDPSEGKYGSFLLRTMYLGDNVLTDCIDQYNFFTDRSAEIVNFDDAEPTATRGSDKIYAYTDDVTASQKQNLFICRISDVLDPATSDTWETAMQDYLCAQASIQLTDEEGSYGIDSSVVSMSFQEAVLAAQAQIDGMSPTGDDSVDTNADKIGALTGLYQHVIKYNDKLLTEWSKSSYNPTTGEGTRIPYYCLCGASINGGEHALGCDGEELILWRPFDGTTEIKNLAEDSTDASVYNYYLTGPYDADINTGLLKINQQDSVDSTSETVDPITVRLDLNGHNITRGNDRVFWLSYQSDTTVCNSRPEKGGVIQSKGVSGDFAGVVWFLKADSGTTAFKMMDGVTLKACEGYNQQEYGGIGLIQGGKFTMYGGRVEGATVTGTDGGGAFRIESAGVLDMQGGVITGGEAQRGGNVYVAKDCKLTMSGEAEITKGKQTSANSSYRGGNVYVANATSADVEVIHLSGNARITEGESVSAGGNVAIGLGSMILEGNAKIIGGKVNGSASNTSADIVLTNATNLTVSDNGTAGYVNCSNANAAVKVEGSAKIFGLQTTDSKVPTVTGALTKDALIRVTNIGAGKTLATIKEGLGLSEQETALAASRIQGPNSIGGTADANGNISESAENWHCVCGAAVKVEHQDLVDHDDGCNEKVVRWDKYTGTISGSGNYYLTENLTNQACVTLSANQTVYIDLNGYNLHATERAFFLNAAGETLWICNTAPAFEGTGIISGKGTTNNNKATTAGVICLTYGKEFRLLNNVTIQLAADQKEVTRGGAVSTRYIECVNMYGGTIIGRKVTNIGGAVDIRASNKDNGTVFTMYGGKIVGGEAAQGGAVYVEDSTVSFIMKDGTITGGKAIANNDYAAHGGAVYNGGTFTMHDGTINGGTSEYGGAVYSAGTFTMNGGTINGGTTYRGGAVYNGDTFTMYDGTINGGTASGYGGSVYSDGAFTIDGSTKEDCSPVITGGTAGTRGGNVYIGKKGSFELKAGTIQNGTVGTANNTAEVHGGNIYINSEISATMHSGSITGGKTLGNEDSHGGNLFVDESRTFTMEGGFITGGEASGQGGNVGIAANGNLRISGEATITDGKCTVNSGVADDIFSQGTVQMSGGHIGTPLITGVNGKLFVKGDAQIDAVSFASAAKIVFEGILGENASIKVKNVDKEIDEEKHSIYEEGSYTEEYWKMSIGNVRALVALSETQFIHLADDGIYLESNSNGAIICPFGYTEETHETGCPCGTPLTEPPFPEPDSWQPLTSEILVKNKITQSGYYYLTDDINVGETGQVIVGSRGSSNEELVVLLDLNGYNIYGGMRALQIWNDAELTLMNTTDRHPEGSKARHEDGGGYITSVGSECDYYALMQTDVDSNFSHCSPTVNMYGNVTLKALGTNKTTNGGGVFLAGNATFNMYGGKVIGTETGATPHSKGECGIKDHNGTKNIGNGGAFMVTAGSTLNVFHGYIEGANSETAGGAIHNSGTANLSNVTIVGAESPKGGCIYNVGTLVLDNAKLSNGTGEEGSAIYNTGTMTLNDVTLRGNSDLDTDRIYTTEDLSIDGDISFDGRVHAVSNKLILGEDLNIKTPFTFKTNWLEGFVTSGTPEEDIQEKITIVRNGDSEEETEVRDGHLLITPLAVENQLVVGFGEADINPTDKQLKYSQAGYMAKYNDGVLSGYYPLSIDGYAQYPAGTAVADSLGLKATAIAYSDFDGDVIVMISVDAAFVGSPDAVRKEIAAAVGIPAENIMISATHAHSTPVARNDKIFYDASGNAYELDETYYETYLKGLKNAAIAAIDDRSAIDTLELATVNDVNESSTYDFNQVRNYKAYSTRYMDKFSDATYVGMYTPNHVTYDYLAMAMGFWPESEVDDSVQLVRYTRTDKKDIVIANFQCHPVLYPTGRSDSTGIIHSDVAGAFRTALAEKLEANVAYFSGAGGNVQCYAEDEYNNARLSEEPNSPHREAITGSGLEKCVKWGEDLAALIKKSLDEESVIEKFTEFDTNVAADKRVVTYEKNVDTEGGGTIDGYQITLEDRQTMAQAITDKGVIGKYMVNNSSEDSMLYTINFGVDFCNPCNHGDSCPFNGQSYNGNQLRSTWGIYSFYHAKTGLVRRMNELMEGDTAELTLYAYAAGPIAFAGAPYEMFDTNGSEIKNGTTNESYYSEKGLQQYDNRFDMTIVATNTGSAATGYVPSRIGYENGGYSTDISPYAAGSGEQFVTEFLAMLNGFKK